MTSKLPAPTHTGAAWWESLNYEEKLTVLEPYLAASYTNKQIADLFDIGLGAVARARDVRKNTLRKQRQPFQEATGDGQANSESSRRLPRLDEKRGGPLSPYPPASEVTEAELRLVQRLYGE